MMLLYSTTKPIPHPTPQKYPTKTGKTFEQSNSKNLPKNTQGKDKKHDNLCSEDILIEHGKTENSTKFKYLGKTTHLKHTTREEIYARIRAAWSCFAQKKKKKMEIFQDR